MVLSVNKLHSIKIIFLKQCTLFVWLPFLMMKYIRSLHSPAVAVAVASAVALFVFVASCESG